MNRLNPFYRFIWDRKGRYVQELTTEDADTWMRRLATEEMKESTKNHYQKAARPLFKWRREARKGYAVGARDRVQQPKYDLHSKELLDQERPPEDAGSIHGVRKRTPLQQCDTRRTPAVEDVSFSAAAKTQGRSHDEGFETREMYLTIIPYFNSKSS